MQTLNKFYPILRVANCTLWFLKLPHSEAKEQVNFNVNILGGSSSVLELLETIGNSARDQPRRNFLQSEATPGGVLQHVLTPEQRQGSSREGTLCLPRGNTFNHARENDFNLRAAQKMNRYLRARMAEVIAELEEPRAGEQREDNNRRGCREGDYIAVHHVQYISRGKDKALMAARRLVC